MLKRMFLDILKNLDYGIIRGSNEEYLPGGSQELRKDYQDVVIVGKLRYALKKLNPTVSEEARELALKQIIRMESQKLKEKLRDKTPSLRDRCFHQDLENVSNILYSTHKYLLKILICQDRGDRMKELSVNLVEVPCECGS
jgi:hypothetical protein